jgi:toxin ParE1/3/4
MHHLKTKTKKYRNVILGSYLIIYRIRPNSIEVLRAFHGSRSPKTIGKIRKITID